MPKGTFTVLWATEESLGYEIQITKTDHTVNITIPKTIAHFFKHREKVRVIIEKVREV